MHAPLWTKSNASFLQGASEPDELVGLAHHLGLRHLALTDKDGVYGAVRAHNAAEQLGVHLIIGSELSIATNNNSKPLDRHHHSNSAHGSAVHAVTATNTTPIVALARTTKGYENLCRIISIGRLRCPKGQCEIKHQELCDHAEGITLLWGGPQSALLAKAPPDRLARALNDAFHNNIYAIVSRHSCPSNKAIEATTRQRARLYGLPTVAANEVLYHSVERRNLQDVLTCIKNGTRIHESGAQTRANAEHYLRSNQAMASLFADDTTSLRRTIEIAEQCTFSLGQIHYRYPSETLPNGANSAQWLRELVLRGARWRYGLADSPDLLFGKDVELIPLMPPSEATRGLPKAPLLQIEKELRLIDKLEYPGYFLTMWEIVRFCQQQRIICQGRGSAANSVVCYCLGITAIDPVRMDLLFERFISEERAEPPDIDLDIQHGRREEVIQHVYTRYGREHAAMVANMVRYRPRSAVRDVGKALGMPSVALDRLAKNLGYHGAINPENLTAAGLDPALPMHQHLIKLSNDLLDFPRHLSIHPGGFLLGHRPVHTLVPIENASMPNRTVIQWDKYDVEALGLFKVDLLGLGALTMMDHAFDLLMEHRSILLSMATIPPEDPDTYEMICAADTVGTFQIESRAQMSMLPRLKPRRFYDLVIQVSIVRPGPITGGMVHPYLRRREGVEPVTYPHPSLEPILARTLGVPLFQEQVMKLAVVAADYTPGEADQLRRDMAAWRRSGKLDAHRDRLVTRMVDKGIELQFAERVFEQIRGFGEYGFPESHGASFALIAYATAWLRCHHLDIFTCALLNAQPMGFYSPATIIEDSKRHGLNVTPINVTTSQWDCTLTASPNPNGTPKVAQGPNKSQLTLEMGARYVKGLATAQWGRVLTARTQRQFTDVEDFARRTGLDQRTLIRLAEVGALESLESNRRKAIWRIRGTTPDRNAAIHLPDPSDDIAFNPLDGFETVSWDFGGSHHSTHGHPLESFRSQLQERGLPDASEVAELRDKRHTRYVGFVICRQRPGTAGGVTFMTLEDETGFVNLVVWPQVFEKYALVAKTASVLGVTGTVQSDNGVCHLIAKRLWVPKLSREPIAKRSRDFH